MNKRIANGMLALSMVATSSATFAEEESLDLDKLEISSQGEVLLSETSPAPMLIPENSEILQLGDWKCTTNSGNCSSATKQIEQA